MYSSGLVFFEPSLVELSLDEVWAVLLDSLENSFLHDIRDV